MTRKLGEGEFGEVFEGIYNKQLKVAIKQRRSTEDPCNLVKEAKTMYRLHHERIVQLLGVCVTPPHEPVLLIVELLPKGSLLAYLQREGESKTMCERILMFVQVSLISPVELFCASLCIDTVVLKMQWPDLLQSYFVFIYNLFLCLPVVINRVLPTYQNTLIPWVHCYCI